MNALFPGFERAQIKVSGASINLVRGQALDCGHYLPEEQPGEVAHELENFLG
jgi:hypothetical protein